MWGDLSHCSSILPKNGALKLKHGGKQTKRELHAALRSFEGEDPLIARGCDHADIEAASREYINMSFFRAEGRSIFFSRVVAAFTVLGMSGRGSNFGKKKRGV